MAAKGPYALAAVASILLVMVGSAYGATGGPMYMGGTNPMMWDKSDYGRGYAQKRKKERNIVIRINDNI
ncbi:hypothetical protein GCM10023331_20320 [Algivirga pacifica]|uniref:Uncharacterized protein n=1 Tax=Algivirga pacifica TaxID=1162670 RepID=A0ABP9DAN2_9BACT